MNEAFVFGAVFNAPVVFFCQNNQWAISEPLERQTRIPLFKRAAGYGFPGVRVDGNDVLAVEAVVTAALLVVGWQLRQSVASLEHKFKRASVEASELRATVAHADKRNQEERVNPMGAATNETVV